MPPEQPLGPARHDEDRLQGPAGQGRQVEVVVVQVGDQHHRRTPRRGSRPGAVRRRNSTRWRRTGSVSTVATPRSSSKVEWPRNRTVVPPWRGVAAGPSDMAASRLGGPATCPSACADPRAGVVHPARVRLHRRDAGSTMTTARVPGRTSRGRRACDRGRPTEGATMPDSDYPLIADHGLIGDLQTAALVTTDGSVDWFCARGSTRRASSARCSTTSEGGHFRIRPAGTSYTTQAAVLPGHGDPDHPVHDRGRRRGGRRLHAGRPATDGDRPAPAGAAGAVRARPDGLRRRHRAPLRLRAGAARDARDRGRRGVPSDGAPR